MGKRQSRAQYQASVQVAEQSADVKARDATGNDPLHMFARIASEQLRKRGTNFSKPDFIALIITLDGIPHDSPYVFYYNTLKMEELIRYARLLLYAPETSHTEKDKFRAYYPKKMAMGGERAGRTNRRDQISSDIGGWIPMAVVSSSDKKTG